MNFFQHQDQARRNTTWLIVLLLLAISSLITLTTLLTASLVYYFNSFEPNTFESSTQLFTAAVQTITWELFAYISLGVCAVVALGSFYKLVQLSKGGQAIADAMGGRLLNINTRNNDERKMLNVVEEMAIASGIPVPPVYLIEDENINAFAAGYQSQDAIIGVTRGCIKQLSRDELQGVIAHEFSHVLQGDMRLNIRLIGILHGILVIGLLGYWLMRCAGHNRYSSRRSNNTSGLFLVGLALMVIGYAGTFFGNIIKAAVSRQREFLADASAVQFTRNPAGISGALKKIGGYRYGSLLSSPSAAEFSHMYFGQGVKTALSGLMATHPPLSQRIIRIDPNWDKQFPSVTTPLQQETHTTTTDEQALSGFDEQTLSTPSAVDSIGNPSPAHIAQAQKILIDIPNDLREAAHDPFLARALVYALLLSRQPNSQTAQRQWLKHKSHPAVYKLFQTFAARVVKLDTCLRLPLVELLMPALKALSEPQYQVFKRNLVALIRTDNKVDLFEWSLYKIITNNTEVKHHTAHKNLTARLPECQQLLSCVARVGHSSSEQTAQAFNQGAKEMGLSQLTLMADKCIKFLDVDRALNRLNQLKPLQKPILLKGLAKCITHDGKVTVPEAELFRAIADSLNCPVPPLLQKQRLA